MFGDGGAFPEIHMAQYPLNMGFTKNQTSNAIQLQVDASGKPQFDAIVKQNVKGNKVRKRFSYLIQSKIIVVCRLSIQVSLIFYRKKSVKMIQVYKSHQKTKSKK